MKILIVAATEFEIAPLRHLNTFENVDFLITGVGMVATAFAIGATDLSAYDVLINAGIAGGFSKNIALGKVFLVVEDVFSELGAQDGEAFLSIDELGFGTAKWKAQIPENMRNMLSHLPVAKGITVNTIHGYTPSIRSIQARQQPDVESMEGAAFFYACNEKNKPCIAFRSISNYVEHRNKAAWNIPLAIQQLNDEILKFLTQISTLKT